MNISNEVLVQLCSKVYTIPDTVSNLKEFPPIRRSEDVGIPCSKGHGNKTYGSVLPGHLLSYELGQSVHGQAVSVRNSDYVVFCSIAVAASISTT
jgi:hypothetical protein